MIAANQEGAVGGGKRDAAVLRGSLLQADETGKLGNECGALILKRACVVGRGAVGDGTVRRRNLLQQRVDLGDAAGNLLVERGDLICDLRRRAVEGGHQGLHGAKRGLPRGCAGGVGGKRADAGKEAVDCRLDTGAVSARGTNAEDAFQLGKRSKPAGAAGGRIGCLLHALVEHAVALGGHRRRYAGADGGAGDLYRVVLGEVDGAAGVVAAVLIADVGRRGVDRGLIGKQRGTCDIKQPTQRSHRFSPAAWTANRCRRMTRFVRAASTCRWKTSSAW